MNYETDKIRFFDIMKNEFEVEVNLMYDIDIQTNMIKNAFKHHFQ